MPFSEKEIHRIQKQFKLSDASLENVAKFAKDEGMELEDAAIALIGEPEED